MTITQAKSDATRALVAFAAAHERWEANLILSEEAWRGGVSEFPTLTEELWDEFMEVQRLRNEAKEALGCGKQWPTAMETPR